MDTIANHKQRLNNLPPELLNIIFGYSDSADLAENRVVCAYWRNIIESTRNTYLEMDNNNWETYVKKSTAPKIHLKLKNVQFPIYQAPEFGDFMSRVNILEITGNIPEYNVINILNGCRQVQSLAIHRIKLDSLRRLVDSNVENELKLDLKQLKIGKARRHRKHTQDLLSVTDYVCGLLKSNCLTELHLSKVFEIDSVLSLLFPEIFEEEPLEELEDKVVQRILNRQRQSLRLIKFYYRHGEVDEEPEEFIKFHRYADASDTNPGNHNLQIFESRLRCSWHYRHFPGLLLGVFGTQFRMRNLDVNYSDQEDLDQIENIIKNNCATLEEITIGSMESTEDTYRSLNCECFAACLTLKQLKLSSENRKVKLVDLLLLPTSLEKLSLTGFIPTGSSELFGGATEPSRYPNLAEVLLGNLPWCIQDGKPVTTFETANLRGLLNVFPNIRKLSLKCIRLDQFLSVREANAMGMESAPRPVSPEFVTWCRQGGGDNVEITSIEISGDNDDNQLNRFGLLRFDETVHEICIGNTQQ